jgi:hypothetical protein
MEAKEKAIQLVFKFDKIIFLTDKVEPKQCALIAVDEILDAIGEIFETYEERKYWVEVKQEIEKL